MISREDLVVEEALSQVRSQHILFKINTKEEGVWAVASTNTKYIRNQYLYRKTIHLGVSKGCSLEEKKILEKQIEDLITHESLHLAMHGLGEFQASKDFDTLDEFGFISGFNEEKI